jgi:NADPH-dependent 2,4-dienoyl-CoA reductase/sulfur reductase-like enzyme
MAISHAWNIDSAAEVRSVVSMPVMAVGRINDPVLAESMLRSNKADFIIMGRGSLADPYLPVKAKEGRLEMIRQCIGCLQGCIGKLQTVGEISCLVNPRLGFEYISIDKAQKSLKVAVAGGGPAGIEAARGAAMRGHSVTLYEKSDRLGGNFQIAAYPPYKGELSSYVAWAGRELEDRGVKILYDTEFTASIAEREKYDAVVIATGAELAKPEGIFISGDRALDARELIYGGKAEAGQNVAVIGGGLVGLEAAVHLGWLGRDVTIFEMKDKIGADIESGVLPALLDLVKQYGLTVLTNANVKSVEGGSVKVSIDGMDREYVFDTVALAFGLKPIDNLAEELKGIVPVIKVAGDASVPAKAVEAVRTGFVAGSGI